MIGNETAKEIAEGVAAQVTKGEYPGAEKPFWGIAHRVAEGLKVDISSRRAAIAGMVAGTAVAATTFSAGKILNLLWNALTDDEDEAEEKDFSTYRVRPSIYEQTCAREYNDKYFGTPIPLDNATAGERALHNSYHLIQIGETQKHASNIRKLERALGKSDSIDVDELLLQRLVADYNLRGLGDECRFYAKKLLTLRNVAPEIVDDHSLAARGHNRTTDLLSTALLNSAEPKFFKDFSDFDVELILQRWLQVGLDAANAGVGELSFRCVSGVRASIYSAIQAKWILKIKDASAEGSRAEQITVLRKLWVEELLAVADGIGASHQYSTEMARDFFFTLCRPAFHALACNDDDHLLEILELCLSDGGGIGDHLVKARQHLLTVNAPNTRWVRLLLVVAYLRAGRRDLAKKRYDELRTLPGILPNTVMARAMAEVGRNFDIDPFRFADANVLSPLFPVPDVDNQRSYFDLVRYPVHSWI